MLLNYMVPDLSVTSYTSNTCNMSYTSKIDIKKTNYRF